MTVATISKTMPTLWSPAGLPRRPLLEVTVRDTGGEVVVCLKGQPGTREAEVLEAALRPIYARRLARVTFDLGGLPFISSQFMGMLVNFRRWALRVGTRLCLSALQPAVHNVFVRTRLIELFEFRDNC